MKTVLVTGGTRGIGLAISDRFRAERWRVVVSSHRAEAGADLVADLSNPSNAVRLYADALRLLGGEPPDALVNNAGLLVGSEAELSAINFESPKRLTMLMAGREDGMGAVVNVLDADALGAGSAADAPYLKSKRSLAGYTREAAMLFAETLRVNGVAPGPVSLPAGVHAPAGEMLLDHRPTAAEVASAVFFLVTATSTTGLVVPVDAGISLLAAR